MGGPHAAYGDKRRFLRLNCDYNRDLHHGDVGLFLTIRLLANIPALSRIEPGHHMPILSPLGQLAEEIMKGLPLRYPDVIRLDSLRGGLGRDRASRVEGAIIAMPLGEGCMIVLGTCEARVAPPAVVKMYKRV